MNPAPALDTSNLSLWALFYNADLIVKLVMVGLLVASVWVWAIAIDKILLYARMRRAMDSFEKAFWSGQSLEELYRSLSSRPTHAMAVAVCRSDARVEAQPRKPGALVRGIADAHREGDGRHHRA